MVKRLSGNRSLRRRRANLFFLVSLRFTQKNRFDIAYISDLGDFSTAHILTFPDYLGAAKQKLAEYEKSQSSISQTDFDNGMKKGISYFNKGMYYEARDEFQWFCDANWGKMNRGQRQYALDYLDSAKRNIQNMSTQNNGTWYHGGAYATSGNVSFWQYSLSVSNITSSSLNVNYFAMSQSSTEVKNARLYKQSDGSYAGSAVIPYEGSIYIKISIISNSHIKLTYGDSYYSETVHFYK